jgi:hypothetical protein
MLEDLFIPDSEQPLAALEGSWIRRTNWDWIGKVSTTAPIVAVTFTRVGNVVRWSRSEKGPSMKLRVRLLLGRYDNAGRDVAASFSIGEGQTQTRTMLPSEDIVPNAPSERTIAVGPVFRFCEPFGEPRVELFGILIFREQVIGARNGLWRLKPPFCAGMPEPFARLMSYGRRGRFILE